MAYHIASSTQSPEEIDKTVKATGGEKPSDDAATANIEGEGGEEEGEGEAEEGEEGEGEAEGEEEPAKSEAAPRKKVSRFQKRFDRLTFEKNQLQREMDTLRGTVTALASTSTASTEARPDPFAFAEPEPNLDNFSTVEEWTKELTAWTGRKVRHELKVDRAHVEAGQRNRETETVIAQHTARVDEFRKTHADFDDVAQEALDMGLPVTPAMNAHFIHSETGPELMYHLAKHPEECVRISKFPFGRQLVELGKIEAKIEGSRKSVSNPASAARTTTPSGSGSVVKRPPTPITPVRGSTGGSKTPSKMTPAEFKAWRAKGGGK